MQNVYTLPRMKPEEMSIYLQGVTRLLGMRIEAGLVERIVTDTDRCGVPSRSLRILIARLCERSRGDVLTHEEYAAVDGIEGVTKDELGAALSSISGSQLDATKALVTNLIHVRTGTRRNLPRDTLLKIAGDMGRSREALVQLFDWNVLATDAGDAVTLASAYYDRSVEKAVAASQGRIGEGELRRWFGTALITPTGTRGVAFRDTPEVMWRIPGLALKELEEAHVIRREDRSGTITHELTHDRFIEPIQKSNHKWLAGYQDAERIRSLKLDWVEFRPEMRRFYPHGTLAAHVLGSTGIVDPDDVIEHGNGGVEMSFDDELSGRPGLARVYNDVRQNAYDSVLARQPEPGTSLTLTIDPNLEYDAERALQTAVEKSGARSGSLVALNPYTGDILAMANYPTYDPNSPPGSREAEDARSNRAITTPLPACD
jgi:hypothetical protein